MSTPPNSTPATIRLLSDLRQISQEPPEGCSASPVHDNDLFTWTATITGPDDTPWEGGVYQLKLVFSPMYPDKPPKVKFITEMFHPNVYGDGTLCLDIIQDKWSPIYSVSSILTSIMSLLTDPNPASPANPEAAALYQSDRKAYNRRVRRCAQKSVEC
eukprot:TRINITY_DN10695_c0_g1_i1.p1 TRINITY_DN10695_c0_g1~~TRINITY_DN10695_c0_g1_i1.p1  ORF type:complete len:158 (-),score=22.77 TRINITY_DN10695_c0_g1_i1:78-551(-)